MFQCAKAACYLKVKKRECVFHTCLCMKSGCSHVERRYEVRFMESKFKQPGERVASPIS